nr:hypothetical protein [Tanacetum cinerariifolium]
MTKVIKEGFDKFESSDDSVTRNTSLEVFHNEFNRLNEMDDDLFTYEVEISELTNVSCNDEVKLSDEESSYPNDENLIDENKVAEIFRIKTNVFDFETPSFVAFKEFNYVLRIDPDVLTKDIQGFKTYDEYKDEWIYEWNKDIPWVHEKLLTNDGAWKKPAPVKHYCKPFNYKSRCSKWPTCSWMNDGYCKGGNLLRAYIVGNKLHYQDLEWYETLKDGNSMRKLY